MMGSDADKTKKLRLFIQCSSSDLSPDM